MFERKGRSGERSEVVDNGVVGGGVLRFELRRVNEVGGEKMRFCWR